MKIGITFGGYCPLHRGHLDVIMKAKKENDLCYVIVCGYDGEPRANEINLHLKERYKLVKEFFKDDEQITVLQQSDTELGLDESMSDSNWEIWANSAMTKIYDAGKFALEEAHTFTFYVAEWNYKTSLERLGYTVEYMDKDLPVSGTAIRKNPFKYWNYIAKTYKPFLAKKILIVGTASEGKTTLVKDISNYFGITNVMEYGREYMEKKNMLDPDLNYNDFREFLIWQFENYKKKLEDSDNMGCVIADTDRCVTLMYAYEYAQRPEMNLSKEEYENLYKLASTLDMKWDKVFMFPPHNKFVDDGSRYMAQSSMSERQKNFDVLCKIMKDFGIEYEILNGNFYENFLSVKDYICG